MKIAMVTPWNVRCGIFTYAKDLAVALAQQDIESFIVRLPRFGNKSPEIMLNIVEQIPFDAVDLVHVQHEYGLYQGLEAPFFTALRTHGKPIVTTMHAVGNWDADTLIAKVSNKVIVHNKYCASRMQFPNVGIIPHGVISAEPTERQDAKSAMKIDRNAPVVGYLGFISNYKGIETLIEAMTKVPKAGLVICGGWFVEKEVEYIERLQNWSKELLLNRVVWKGYIPEEKLADAYGAMDVLVYPSRFATESGALAHAIAHGKAIIASNIEPFKEKKEEGALMTFDNSDDLAEKIKFLLSDSDARHALEEGAIEYAQRNSWASVAKRHIDLYRELLHV